MADRKMSRPRSAAPSMPLSDDALETSKLLVEVLQAGYPARRTASMGSSPEPGATHPRTSGPLAPHVIRAAIHVYGHGPVTIGQLAEGLGVSQGWASRVVDEMERTGYLERERDVTDRRIVRVRLAPSAVAEVERAYRWRGDAVEAALAELTPEGRLAVRTFLRRFVDGLSVPAPGGPADPGAAGAGSRSAT